MGEKTRVGHIIDAEPESASYGSAPVSSLQGLGQTGTNGSLAPVTITGFTLSSLPWWAWVTIGVVSGIIVAKVLPKVARALA